MVSAGAVLLAGAVVLLARGDLPAGFADEARRDVRLVVSSDEPTRAKVLEALRDLPVDVHDLRTMERVALARTEPFPPGARPLVAVVARVSQANRVSIQRIEMNREHVSIVLVSPDVGALENVARGLETSLPSTQVERGPLTRRDAGTTAEVRLRIRPGVGGGGWKTSGAPPLAEIHAALAPLAVVSISTESREPVEGGFLASRTVRGKGDLAEVREAMQRVEERVPGVRVTALEWREGEESASGSFTLAVSTLAGD
jgi:hypothetical protein